MVRTLSVLVCMCLLISDTVRLRNEKNYIVFGCYVR